MSTSGYWMKREMSKTQSLCLKKVKTHCPRDGKKRTPSQYAMRFLDEESEGNDTVYLLG